MLKITHLEFQNCRSFTNKTKVEFSPDLNIIIGPNGAGKTTILEALKFAISGSAPATFPTKSVPPPFNVTASAHLTNNTVLDQEICVSGKSQKRILTQNAQISPGIMNFLIFCSVEDAFWMFQKPAEIYKTANEIFDVEKLAKFSVELGSEGNKRAKAETNVMDLMQIQREKQKCVRVGESSKEACEVVQGCLSEFKEIQASFNGVIGLGEVLKVIQRQGEIDVDEDINGRLEVIKQQQFLLQSQLNGLKEQSIGFNISQGQITQQEFEECKQIVEQFVQTMQDVFSIQLLQEGEQLVDSKNLHSQLNNINIQFVSQQDNQKEQLNQLLVDQKSLNQQLSQNYQQLISIEDQQKDINEYESNQKLIAETQLCVQQTQLAIDNLVIEDQGLVQKISALKLQNKGILNVKKLFQQYYENQQKSSYLQNSDIIQKYKQFQQNLTEYSGLIDADFTQMLKVVISKYEQIIKLKSKLILKFSYEADYIKSIQLLLNTQFDNVQTGVQQAQLLMLNIDQKIQINNFSLGLQQLCKNKNYDLQFCLQLTQLLQEYQQMVSSFSKNQELLQNIENHIQFGNFLQLLSSIFNLSDIQNIDIFLQNLQLQIQLSTQFTQNINQLELFNNRDLYINLCQLFKDDSDIQSLLQNLNLNQDNIQSLKQCISQQNLQTFIEQPKIDFNFDMFMNTNENEIKAQTKDQQYIINSIKQQTQFISDLKNKLKSIQPKFDELKYKQILNEIQLETLSLWKQKAEINLLISQNNQNIENIQSEIEQCKSSPKSKISNILQLIEKIQLYTNNKQAIDIKNQIISYSDQLLLINGEIDIQTKKLQTQQQYIFQLQEVENQKAKQSILDSHLREIKHQLPKFIISLNSVFELNKTLKAQIPTQPTKQLLAAASSLQQFQPPYNDLTTPINAINDYLIAFHSNAKSLANQTQNLKLLNQKQQHITASFASNLTNLNLAKELKLASQSLKQAITDFQDTCFTRANQLLNQLWTQIYARKDIETIKLSRNVVKQTLEVLGYTNLEWRPLAGMISAGQKALASILIRVAIVSALDVGISIFCTDEPTNFLDEGNEGELGRVLSEFCKRSGLQFIVITHSENFGEKLGRGGDGGKVIKVVNGVQGSKLEREVV